MLEQDGDHLRVSLGTELVASLQQQLLQVIVVRDDACGRKRNMKTM